MKRPPMKPAMTWTEAQRRFPDAALEFVGDRAELVIYTGLTLVEGSDDKLRDLTSEELSA